MMEFWGASSERQIGMGVGPIPRSVLIHSTERLGLDEFEADIFLQVMQTLDAAYLREQNNDGSDPTNKPPVVSQRTASINLFDAMFS